MEQTPTAREAIGLTMLAQQLRASAAETDDQDYVGLFLSAALALEARALAAPPFLACTFDRGVAQELKTRN